jgi:hypothetical protein
VTSLSDVHTIRAHQGTSEPSDDDKVAPYYFAFSHSDASKFSILEASVKFGVGATPQQRGILSVQEEGSLETTLSQGLQENNQSATARPKLYSVRIPSAYLRRAHAEESIPDITLYLHALLLHTSIPLPPSVGQTESQFLKWSGDATPIAVYDVEKARVKVK